MSSVSHEPQADPLFARPRPERPAYATGMMLGARDFADEQTYHRGQLARALAYLAGPSTLAGLRVGYVSPTDEHGTARPEEVRVEPGIAVDWLGRLIEVPRAACVRLPRWFAAQEPGQLTQAAYPQGGGATLAELISARAASEASAGLPARAVLADLYLRFVSCDAAYSPAFASGPYDALDAIATSRVRDAYELLLVPRSGLAAAAKGLPDLGPDLAVIADVAARRAALQDQLLDASYHAVTAKASAGSAGDLKALSGNPEGVDPSAVFLARVLVPVAAANPPLRDGTGIVIDNYSRRFLPAAALLARWVGA